MTIDHIRLSGQRAWRLLSANRSVTRRYLECARLLRPGKIKKVITVDSYRWYLAEVRA